MPRALWSGSLSFGLVNVPVQLVSAARDLDYHFHQLHEADNVRIEQRRFCKKENVEVPWEEIGHADEVKGKQVVITDEELASVEPRKTRTIEIEAFVDLAEVDPIYFDHPYYLMPAGEAEGTIRAYRLLVAVMEDEEQVALGRFVMRTKEYLAAVRVRDGALALTTMLFDDEIRDPKDVPTGGKKPTKKALDNAVAIIEELTTEWDPSRYRDCYRERLERVIKKKRKGGTVTAPETEDQPRPVPDLMEALERTLEEVKRGGDAAAARKAARESTDDDDALEDLALSELRKRAGEKKIAGRSKMDRRKLVKALRDE